MLGTGKGRAREDERRDVRGRCDASFSPGATYARMGSALMRPKLQTRVISAHCPVLQRIREATSDHDLLAVASECAPSSLTVTFGAKRLS